MSTAPVAGGPAAPAGHAGRSRSLFEIGFAAVLVAAAAAVVATASRFPFESAAYPVIIGTGVAVLGGFIALREALRRRRGRPTPGGFALHTPRLAIGIACIVAYVAAVSSIGFVLPSLALCTLVPAAVGFRRWRLLLTVALACVLSIVVIFVHVLERPLPADILARATGLLR